MRAIKNDARSANLSSAERGEVRQDVTSSAPLNPYQSPGELSTAFSNQRQEDIPLESRALLMQHYQKGTLASYLDSLDVPAIIHIQSTFSAEMASLKERYMHPDSPGGFAGLVKRIAGDTAYRWLDDKIGIVSRPVVFGETPEGITYDKYSLIVTNCDDALSRTKISTRHLVSVPKN